MSSNREIIAQIRKSIQEKDVDSTFTNKYLFSVANKQSKWLIRREINAGRIFRSKSLFQTAPCQPVVKASKISDCCPIKTNCTVFRTRYKLDDIWENELGPLFNFVTSIDGSTEFLVVSAKEYKRKKDNPYGKKNTEKYAFYSDGYIWWEKEAPKKINISAFYVEDIDGKFSCEDECENNCKPFLDKKFMFPSWVEAELIAKSTEFILGTAKRLPADESIDKSENRKA